MSETSNHAGSKYGLLAFILWIGAGVLLAMYGMWSTQLRSGLSATGGAVKYAGEVTQIAIDTSGDFPAVRVAYRYRINDIAFTGKDIYNSASVKWDTQRHYYAAGVTIGQLIPILYDPTRPEVSAIDQNISSSVLQALSGITACLSAMCFICAVISTIIAVRQFVANPDSSPEYGEHALRLCVGSRNLVLTHAARR